MHLSNLHLSCVTAHTTCLPSSKFSNETFNRTVGLIITKNRVDFSLPILYYGIMSNFKQYYQDKNIVFITIVTYNRQQILVENIELLRQFFKKVKYSYEIIAGIVLPDHLHILMQTDKASGYSKIISSLKSNFSRLLPKNMNQTQKQLLRREKGIWQRKYYDHIIRDDMDFNKHLDYIHYNSVKHLNISPKDWQFSSFKKNCKTRFLSRRLV